MLSREYGDLAGAGGVKDVCKQLAESFARWAGRDVRVVLPLYGFMEPRGHGFELLQDHLVQQPLRFEVDMDYVLEGTAGRGQGLGCQKVEGDDLSPRVGPVPRKNGCLYLYCRG